MANGPTPVQADSPDALRYNRIRRWLGVADFVVGFFFLVILLVTGWSGWLRDLAIQLSGQHYALNVFLYLLFLLVISKTLGFGLDYTDSDWSADSSSPLSDSAPGCGMRSRVF